MKVKNAHSLLECMDLLVSQCISLGNDGYQIDFGMESTHKLNIDGAKPIETKSSSCARSIAED